MPTEASSRFRQRLPWIAVAVLLLGAFAFWRLTRNDAPAAQFQTAPVDRGEVVSRVSASGSLSATVTVDVGSQVSGRIQSLFADYNSVVRKGELVAKIDPALFEAAVAQSRANVMASEGNLARLQVQAEDVVRRTWASALSMRSMSSSSLAARELVNSSARASQASSAAAKPFPAEVTPSAAA